MKNKIKIYQVDAFTSEAFKGNPAAVCILENDISDELMKNIAQEMNLSETAFVKPLKNLNIGKGNLFSLRWFTPEVEVDLCGHATIATSKVLFDEFNIKEQYIKYETKSGLLTAKKKDEKISLDFPIDKALDFNLTQDILDAMGIRSYSKAIIGEKTRKLVIEVKDKENIINLKPNFEILKSLKFKSDVKGIGVTCRGNEKYDFISRYFNSWDGINEDPVTGSVHTLLANYWSNKLNKMDMNAYQASNRSGEISLKLLENDRVRLSGEAVIVLRGELYL
ncbi:PhzF family phenazine biosynthesis protein [Clostridium tertium]|uniref:PhzF family phenazine biosynthesis protein n=1 Tax=Clostridium tertium TaxID=1559 RepID=A0A9X4AYT1_9CLOT|nr:PhzF family phenazine biosynthesis protein [Clostridium tertium]MDC4238895.1 PhzF family phenazine biosynthesis protein [Clostridium tertium]